MNNPANTPAITPRLSMEMVPEETFSDCDLYDVEAGPDVDAAPPADLDCSEESTKRINKPVKRKSRTFYERLRGKFGFLANTREDHYETQPIKTAKSLTKQELHEIHRALSVRSPHFDRPSANITSPKQEHVPPNLELCMEFCWCFHCCFPYFRLWIPSGTGSGALKNSLYELSRTLLYTPLVDDNETKKLTNLQIVLIIIRMGFELYKTMIGSYLTVFTPQQCNGKICSLLENVVPKDRTEIAALAMNTVMAFALLSEYVIEMIREKILRMYFVSDQRLPVEKEYFTNLLAIIDTQKAALLGEKSRMISMVFRLYRRIGIVLLSLYFANVCISGVVIYKNYYDKSSMFGFATNALFIVFKMASILKIAIHSISMPYSAYIETPVAFNSLKTEYIKTDVKNYFLLGATSTNPTIPYFRENAQYIQVLLEGLVSNVEHDSEPDPLPVIRHRKSFG